MSYIELPKQQLVAFSSMPAIDEWQSRLEKMSDDEVEKHRQFAIACLAQDVQSQSWSPHIEIAEAILETRKGRD